MTINALRGRSNTGDTRPETPAIGEDDANQIIEYLATHY